MQQNYQQGNRVTLTSGNNLSSIERAIVNSIQGDTANVKVLRSSEGQFLGAVDLNDTTKHVISSMDDLDVSLGIIKPYEMAMMRDPRQAGQLNRKRNWNNRSNILNSIYQSQFARPEPVSDDQRTRELFAKQEKGQQLDLEQEGQYRAGMQRDPVELEDTRPVVGETVGGAGTRYTYEGVRYPEDQRPMGFVPPARRDGYPSAPPETPYRSREQDLEEEGAFDREAFRSKSFSNEERARILEGIERRKDRTPRPEIEYIPYKSPTEEILERRAEGNTFVTDPDDPDNITVERIPAPVLTLKDKPLNMLDSERLSEPSRREAFVQDTGTSQMVSEGRPSGVSTEKFVEQPPEGMPSGVSTERPFVREPSVDVTEERSPDPNLDISKNPGNVRYVEGVDFAGGTGKDDSGFATFDSDEAGLRVLFMTLQQGRYRDKTIAEIANTYSPPNENTAEDIQGKINVITQELARFGITGADSKVDVNDPEILEALARAIIKSEKTPEETEYYLNLPQNIWDRAQRDSTRDMQAGGVISFVQPKKFTPQEQRYLDFHRKNLDEGLGRENPDGSMTTILGKIISDQEGTAYLIPGYNPSNKKNMTDQEAWDRANEIGLENFPSAASVDLMRATEKELKEVINQDMEDYRKNMQAGGEVPQINKSGLIQGEGGPTSDSIPMKAEPDSFIINAPAVEMAGGKKKIDSMVNKVQKQQSVSGFNQFGNPVTGAQDINVSNGEYKVSKKDAQKIGYDTLNNINDAGKPFVAQLDSRGYAEGDRVSESQAEPMQVKFGDKTLNVTDQEIEGLAKLLYAEDRDTVATDAILGVIINRMNIALHTKKGKRDFVSTKDDTPVSLMNIMAYPNAFEPVSSNPIRNGVLTFDLDNDDVANLQEDKPVVFSNLKNLIKNTFNEINSKTYSNPAGKALWFQNPEGAKGTGLTKNVENEYFNTYSTRIIPQEIVSDQGVVPFLKSTAKAAIAVIEPKEVEFYEVNPDKKKVAASKKIDFNSSYDRDFYNKAKELNYNTSIPLPVYKPEGFMATEGETDRSTIEPADTSFINGETSPRISIVPTTQDLGAAGQNF